jgi:predicted lipoprotein with Yx(FWY)xxD motif
MRALSHLRTLPAPLAALGTIFTGGQGFSRYAFEADQGTMSRGTGACAAAWPPVTTPAGGEVP